MTRKSIDPAKLTIQAHDLFHKQWMLLTCGDFDEGKFSIFIPKSISQCT